jgi:hypothetical protein
MLVRVMILSITASSEDTVSEALADLSLKKATLTDRTTKAIANRMFSISALFIII